MSLWLRELLLLLLLRAAGGGDSAGDAGRAGDPRPPLSEAKRKGLFACLGRTPEASAVTRGSGLDRPCGGAGDFCAWGRGPDIKARRPPWKRGLVQDQNFTRHYFKDFCRFWGAKAAVG